MAEEPNEPLFPAEYEAEYTQGHKRRMVAKAKAAPLIAKDVGQTREFWNKLRGSAERGPPQKGKGESLWCCLGNGPPSVNLGVSPLGTRLA